MKTFQDFMLECQSLEEGGMNRIMSHSQKRNTAVLTANRGDKSRSENKARNAELGKKIRSMGYGYKKVSGEYPEKDDKTGETKLVKEPSVVVNAPKKKGRVFKRRMKRLGKEYNQDAVITKKGKGPATLNPTHKRAGSKGMKLGQAKPDTTGEYGQTRVKSRTYTYDK
jgi:hypothetical protein